MKKKKIIIFMPSIEGGGVEKNLFIVTNYLSKKIKNLFLITVSKRYKNKFNREVKLITPTFNFWDHFGRRIKYLIAILLLIKEILRNKNCIVFSFQANIYCIIVCKLLFVKVITRSNSAPIGWSQNNLKRIIYKFFLNKADKIMVNSNEFKKDLKKEFNVNSTCIYNPLNVEEILKKSKQKSKKYFNSKKNLKILNIGRYTDQKDQLTLLKSLNLLKEKLDYEAIIVGRGEKKTELENFIKKNKLNKNVKLINFLKNPYTIIKQSEVFVLSSLYEGLPNVILESLTLKKMIISTDCRTGPKEILLNGKGGLLCKVGDHKDIAEKILFYANNKKKCEKLLNFAINNLSRFDYNENLKKYFNLLF